MQMSVPELIDFKSEPKNVMEMYGPKADARVGTYAYNCLLASSACRARRPLHPTVSSRLGRSWERSQGRGGPMPRHGPADRPRCFATSSNGGMLDGHLGRLGRRIRSHRLLPGKTHSENVWARPSSQLLHLLDGWRRGVRGGMTYGETDDYSVNVTENPVHVHDLQATILHQLGIDHERPLPIVVRAATSALTRRRRQGWCKRFSPNARRSFHPTMP